MNRYLLSLYLSYEDRYKQQSINILLNIRRTLPYIASILITFFCVEVYAETAAEDAALQVVADNFRKVVILGLQLVLAIVFLIVAWAVISKFNDARRGRADWGEVVIPFVIGAAVVVLIGWLATEGEKAAELLKIE